MTDIARWQPARLPSNHARGAVSAPPSRQFGCFAFYALDPAWLQINPTARQADAQELAAVVQEQQDRLLVHAYSTLGANNGIDFLLWQVAPLWEDLETLAAAIRRTRMGSRLRLSYSCLGLTDTPSGPQTRRGEGPISGRYLLVRPITWAASWDALSEDERDEMTRELARPVSDSQMTRFSGFDAHDALLVFEADRPEALSDALDGLRKTPAHQYFQRGTPVFTGVRQEIAPLLARVVGV